MQRPIYKGLPGLCDRLETLTSYNRWHLMPLECAPDVNMWDRNTT
jgi:hypothetical protein